MQTPDRDARYFAVDFVNAFKGSPSARGSPSAGPSRLAANYSTEAGRPLRAGRRLISNRRFAVTHRPSAKILSPPCDLFQMGRTVQSIKGFDEMTERIVLAAPNLLSNDRFLFFLCGDPSLNIGA